MKRISILITAIAMAASSMAVADFRTTARAYEVRFDNLRMPQSANGRVTFKECADCEEITIPVNVTTQYLVNGEVVELKDFRRIVFRARRNPSNSDNAATVLRNLESDTAVSIAVYL